MAADSDYGSSAIRTIDPRVRYTLDKLDSLVGSSGGLRSAQEVPKLISLMKETTDSRHPLLLINRCLILNVLQSTKAQSTLTKFMEGGGWSLLNVWLSDGKKSQNVSFLLEILQVLQKLPVNIVALKQGNLGKLVKQLSKHESPEVKSLSNDILSKWMTVFREGQAARGKATPTGSKLEGGPSTGPSSSAQLDESTRVKEKEREERKVAKKLKKELQNAETQGAVPLGPLVALGKPRDKLKKRPRDLSITKSVPEKKPKVSPLLSAGDEEEKEKAQKMEKGLMESNIFMDTLSSQAAAKWQEKRIKKLNKSGPKPSPTQTKPPSDIETPPPSADGPHPLTNGVDSLNGDGGEIEDNIMETDDSESKRPKKKKVSWADDKNLVSIHYFEMDESERINVSVGKSFLDAAQREKLMEKEALSSIAYNQLVEVMQWYRPLLIDCCIELAQRGKESNEKLVQAQREETVLAQLFLSKSSVLPTPTEPDPVPDNEEGMEEKVKAIPLLEPGAPAAPSVPPFGGPPYGPVGDQLVFNDQQSYNQESQNHSPHYYQGGPAGAFPPGDPNFRGPPDPMGQNYPPHYGYPPHPSSMDYQYYPDTNGGGGAYHSTRGWGRGRNRYSKGNICKHFISHGCRLGSNCRFLHVAPEELNNSPETDSETRSTGDSGKEREREERVVSPDQKT